MRQEDLSEFDERRARLVFEGFAFNPETTYFVQFRNDTIDTTTQPTTTRSTTQLYDAYVDLKQIPWANLRVGQYRTLFGRQEYVSSALLQFVDRGFVARPLCPTALIAAIRESPFTAMTEISHQLRLRRVQWGGDQPDQARLEHTEQCK